MNQPTPVLLAILDGWGYGPPSDTNAIYVASTPNMKHWQQKYPFTTLLAHNGAVGLPAGQMGNSEVGHLNIGAGRIVFQDFTRINLAIDNGDFLKNEVLARTLETARDNGGALHFLGLVSDGGVHSHINHLKALIAMAAQKGLDRVFVHAFMDGRDTPPHSGAGYIENLQEALAKTGCGRIASITGRFYVMDRDRRWKRVQEAWQALVDGRGIAEKDPVQAMQNAYARGETDEFIKPIIITDDNGRPLGTIADGDSVLCFNFRADRVRELTHAFTDPDFQDFSPARRPSLRDYVTFTQYDKHFTLPVVFPPVTLKHILGEEISRHGLRQLRIAETEKYAHVTYFFNGGIEEPFPGEDRALIQSPKEVATYDQKPEMSAFEVTDELLRRLDENKYSLVVLNFANGDMVGHTGVMAAAIRACEAVDQCLGRLVQKFTGMGGMVIITADHGNADKMYDQQAGEPFTAHTSNPVPLIMISDRYLGRKLRTDGALKDIAPSVLTLMGLPVPTEMEGECLLIGGCRG